MKYENHLIVGDRITLKSITLNDTNKIIEWRNKDWVRKNFILQELLTEEVHWEWFANKIQTCKVIQFIVQRNDNAKKIGSVYLRDVDYEHKKAEFGIFIGEEDSVGSGYGTEAVNLITEFGFNKLKLHSIYLRVLAENKNAIKCYQKAGFKQKTTYEDEAIINGKFRSVLIMEKLGDEE